jgi:hypothetical protein
MASTNTVLKKQMNQLSETVRLNSRKKRRRKNGTAGREKRNLKKTT